MIYQRKNRGQIVKMENGYLPYHYSFYYLARSMHDVACEFVSAAAGRFAIESFR